MIPAKIVQKTANAPAFWQADILWLVLASAETTDGEYSLIEELCPKDSGPPPHTHVQREMFYIIEGEIKFLVGEEIVDASDGTYVCVPPDTVHSFRVTSETARILNSYTPAGFERIILEAGVPALSRTLPPKGLGPRVNPETLSKLIGEVGMTVVDKEDVLRKNT